MLPISPPLPLIHKTVALLPSSGSVSSILELVFPPPKFVTRRSDPNKLDRYRSNSAPSRLFAIWSSQRSSRYRSFSLDFMGKTIVGFQAGDRKSTRLNSSHSQISYAVFCLKKKKKNYVDTSTDNPYL